MSDDQKRVPALFFRTDAGAEPVRDWLKGLSKADRKVLGVDIKTLEYGWPVGMPLCRSIRSRRGLWEIRSSLTGGRIARILFCFHDGSLLLLHGFIKKTQKTPTPDLDLAADRMKELKTAQLEKGREARGNRKKGKKR